VSTGFVSLVGAGPGDPELLTLRALDRLRGADLILYDALVSPAVLALAPKAQRFFVGKRAKRNSITQAAINRLLVRAARRGRRVVRLKAGDPFVFGRGGEEALALHEAGVAYEVVPGISAALAAPALAGIPVTHRGAASAFIAVSGHAECAWAPVLEQLLPQSATIVILMGLASRGLIGARLLARGWAPDTPAAVLVDASTPQAQSWMGTLRELARTAAGLESNAAGTVVIGEVVRVGQQLAEPLVAATRTDVFSPARRDASFSARGIRLQPDSPEPAEPISAPHAAAARALAR
jgi:uroporphyrin-III C-methyltransferase / precorrin-2 dehydrogenase / sirohydrochlorin ferrochelatase